MSNFLLDGKRFDEMRTYEHDSNSPRLSCEHRSISYKQL